MTESKQENHGMSYVILGSIFSAIGSVLSSGKEFGNLPLMLAVLGLFIIIYGLTRIFIANMNE